MIAWSDKAKWQLREAYSYVKRENPRAATKIITLVKNAVEMLPDNPYIGKQVSDNLFELFVPHTRYVIHYTVSDQILILGLYHERQERPF